MAACMCQHPPREAIADRLQAAPPVTMPGKATPPRRSPGTARTNVGESRAETRTERRLRERRNHDRCLVGRGGDTTWACHRGVVADWARASASQPILPARVQASAWSTLTRPRGGICGNPV